MEIIRNSGVCDPHIHIFRGKAYMFSSHDAGPHNSDYTMLDWQVFSSDDLLNWKKEFVLRPADTFLGKAENCFATDGAERNGKYYLYFSDAQNCVGVAVSETGPGGPYHNALGKPLLPAKSVDTPCYDPTVFIDDDPARTPYIIFGYTCADNTYHIARLNEDMISLAEEPRPIELINGWKNDANWITKKRNTYYLNSHGGVYATADNIYGPYTYRGVFCHDRTVDHCTFFTFHNQQYAAYGIPAAPPEAKPDPFYRTAKIVYAYFRENGEISVDTFSQEAGVGQYDARWPEIRAVWYFAASDSINRVEKSDGNDVIRFGEGNSYLAFPNIRGIFQDDMLILNATYSGSHPCTIEIHEGSPYGTVVGWCKTDDTNGRYTDIECPLNITFGTHNLCLVVNLSKESELLLSTLRFQPNVQQQ